MKYINTDKIASLIQDVLQNITKVYNKSSKKEDILTPTK